MHLLIPMLAIVGQPRLPTPVPQPATSAHGNGPSRRKATQLNTASEESWFCRTCRHPLIHRLQAGRDQLVHHSELRGGSEDHVPDPVTLAELPEAIRLCDFCTLPEVVWAYRCAEQVTDNRRVVAEYVDHGDFLDRDRAARVIRTDTTSGAINIQGSTWLACQGCADAVERGAVDELISRHTDQLPAQQLKGRRLILVRAILRQDFEHVLTTRHPDRHRLTPTRPLGEPAPKAGAAVPDWRPGDRVALVFTDDKWTDLVPGDTGTVHAWMPEVGQLWIDWDRGSRLAMVAAAGDRVTRI
ncbi:DUF4314 domain-containing protein [Longispora sp. K20-0274]|uniref:DUF4314 domain-containing protein n=1 Tax=Longispora sp. K20-0274 TaxID=3088255 RepID=UPI00399AC25E